MPIVKLKFTKIPPSLNHHPAPCGKICADWDRLVKTGWLCYTPNGLEHHKTHIVEGDVDSRLICQHFFTEWMYQFAKITHKDATIVSCEGWTFLSSGVNGTWEDLACVGIDSATFALEDYRNLSAGVLLSEVTHLVDIVPIAFGFYVLETIASARNQRITQEWQKLYSDIPYSRDPHAFEIVKPKLNLRFRMFLESLADVYEEYTTKHARNIFDYLALACLGELRHAKFLKWSATGKSRKGAWQEGASLDPLQALEVCVEAFNTKGWGPKGGFGGESWAKIAKAALIYHRFPPAVFIDHVFDLTHNGGLVWDKGYLIHCDSQTRLMEVLDAKRTATVFKSPKPYVFPTGAVLRTTLAAIEIGLIPDCINYGEFVLSEDVSPLPPIIWGTSELKVDHEYRRETPKTSNEDGDSEDEEEETEEYPLTLSEAVPRGTE